MLFENKIKISPSLIAYIHKSPEHSHYFRDTVEGREWLLWKHLSADEQDQALHVFRKAKVRF